MFAWAVRDNVDNDSDSDGLTDSEENDIVGLGSWLNKTKDLIKQICSTSHNTPKDLINHLVELTDENLASTRQRRIRSEVDLY